jgi:predicted metal-dependent peptidase
MFAIPDAIDEPFTRLMLAQPQLAAFMLESGIYILMDHRDNPTACTDGARWIRCNPDFMKACRDGSKGVKQADIFVLAHEVVHCMLMHYRWMRSVREHGFYLTEQLAREVRRFNPATKWRAGRTIPALQVPMQHAMDYVINALLDQWGMKIRPYQVLLDPQIALWTDSEDTAYCRLIGKHKIEPEDVGGGDGGEGKGGTLTRSQGDQPGTGGGDMVEGYPGDMPAEAEGPNGPKPFDEVRRKMAVEVALRKLGEKHQGTGGLGMDRVIDRLLPSRIKWRQHFRHEVKASAGRGHSTWNNLSRRSLTLGSAMPGRISKRHGLCVFQADCSGSVDQAEMEQVAGCAVDVMKQVSFERMIVLDTDGAVQQVREPKDAQELHRMLMTGFKGGGGTKMEAGFEWCKEKKLRPATIITVTDGHTSWPRDMSPAKHALWVITTPGIVAPKEAGTSVYMPLDRNT